MRNWQNWWNPVVMVCSIYAVAQAEEFPLTLLPDSQVSSETLILDPNKKRQKSSEGQPFLSSTAILTGFWDTRVGMRTQEDKHEDQTSLAETRIRVNLELSGERAKFRLSSDLLYDAVEDDQDIDLETGAGFFDLREASVQIKPLPNLNIKAGRQTLSWGGGGLLSINDRFPKDFQSFLLGRDLKYLRAPSDAVKFTLHSKQVNLDLVYTPRFDANRFIDGSRLSLFNRNLGRLSGNQNIAPIDKPDDWFSDDETALRLSRNSTRDGVNYESALYTYRGFWKRPAGFNPFLGKAIFPRLGVYGASLRRRVAHGGGKLEFGYYDSMDDKDGNNPLIRNSEIRFKAGYKQALSKDLILGGQYYVEHMLDYDAHKRTLPANQVLVDENHHILSFRLTRLLKKQDLKLSLTGFYSPSDHDGYLRPVMSYQLGKDWIVDGGANWFFGKTEQTFFGQLENNTNVYLGVRYNFANR